MTGDYKINEFRQRKYKIWVLGREWKKLVKCRTFLCNRENGILIQKIELGVTRIRKHCSYFGAQNREKVY